MRFSEAKGHKVVSTATAETVGKVEELIVDPAARAVIALKLKKTHGDGDTLAWRDLLAFGADAVTVDGAERIGEADAAVAARSDKHHRLLGRRTLSTAGDELGQLDDVEFDPETGAITGLVVHGADAVLDGARLVGVGTYAVVIAV